MNFHQPLVMGVLNVTPDSFSDGGDFIRLEAALDHARVLQIAGADIIDIGGESTRPGAKRVTLAEEQARVLPVIEAIVAELGAKVSIDTMSAETARLAVAAGASIINDVSGGLADPDMFKVAADTGRDHHHFALARVQRPDGHPRHLRRRCRRGCRRVETARGCCARDRH